LHNRRGPRNGRHDALPVVREIRRVASGSKERGSSRRRTSCFPCAASWLGAVFARQISWSTRQTNQATGALGRRGELLWCPMVLDGVLRAKKGSRGELASSEPEATPGLSPALPLSHAAPSLRLVCLSHRTRPPRRRIVRKRAQGQRVWRAAARKATRKRGELRPPQGHPRPQPGASAIPRGP
jgi:hypothetical protein